MSITSEDTYKLLGLWSSESSASSEIKMPESVVCGAMHCCVVGVPGPQPGSPRTQNRIILDLEWQKQSCCKGEI